MKDLEFIAKELRNISLLTELANDTKKIELFASYCEERQIPKGTYIYREGDASTDLYILVEGTVSLLKKTRFGDDFTLSKLHGANKAFFGEVSLIEQGTRTATVYSEEELKVLIMSQKNFHRLALEHPVIALGLSYTICRILAQRVRRTNNDILYLYDALAAEMDGQL